MRGAVHHVDLTVKDPAASVGFYDAVLGFMGYRRVASHDNGYDWDVEGAEGFCSIGILKAHSERPHDRYAAGLHHIAWTAASREDVDRLHILLIGMGATILDAPADYPRYGEGYYAVFFADPDGLKLEYVFKPHPARD